MTESGARIVKIPEFETGSTRLCVANASTEGAPAATQPYHAFCLQESLAHNPDTAAPALPCPPLRLPVSAQE